MSEAYIKNRNAENFFCPSSREEWRQWLQEKLLILK